jgi:hypothetical protein
MSEELNQAIHNLRAEVLIRKLSIHNKYLSKNSAINLVTINSDDEAFNYAILLDHNLLSYWMKDRLIKVLNFLKKQ